MAALCATISEWIAQDPGSANIRAKPHFAVCPAEKKVILSHSELDFSFFLSELWCADGLRSEAGAVKVCYDDEILI